MASQSYSADIASAARHRHRVADDLGMPQDRAERYRLAVLPFNSAGESSLPTARRILLEQHLRKCLVEARARFAQGEPVERMAVSTIADERAPAELDAERDGKEQLLVAACTSCRGKCCTKGGNRAFLSAETMLRIIERSPLLDDDAIIARYLSFVGEHTLTDGCIYQGASGCTLPRDLRSDLCNRYYCGDIRVLTRQFSAGDPVRAFIVNRNGEQLQGGQFFEVSET